ncbi:MAG: hypothetical protein ACTSW1_17325 [Candidatus Hodarchaeales archaeon]
MFELIDMYGVDTFSWTYILRLRDNGFRDLIERIMKKREFMITHEVYRELKHRFPEEVDFFRNVTILPVLHISLSNYCKQGFDLADASLLEYSEYKGYIIISEDQPMLTENIIEGRIRIIHLADYLSLKMLEGDISSNELYKIIRTFRLWRVISKKKAKRVLRLRLQLK